MRALKTLTPAHRTIAFTLVLGLPLLSSCSSSRHMAEPSSAPVSSTAAANNPAAATPNQSAATALTTPLAQAPDASAAPATASSTAGTVTSGDEVERGPHCTAEDLKQPTSPDDITAETSRDQALKEVGRTLAASEHTIVDDSLDNTSAYVVKVEAGASVVEVNALATVVVIEGDIDTLIVNGTASTIWVDNVDHVQMGADSAGNYVHWTGSKPDLLDNGTGNTTARAEYAMHVHHYC
ncbi:hypothetical protein [Actinomyces trachealis]|uniref:hypothetical protein n=1 Tax=Actinomyces trachealis TaxID=2763540 RepID=UPI0018C5D41A|nr:hypothetical protein [Actinomyces trachealis]